MLCDPFTLRRAVCVSFAFCFLVSLVFRQSSILLSPQNSLAGLSDSIKALGNETKLSIDEINSKLGAFPTHFTQAIDNRFTQLS